MTGLRWRKLGRDLWRSRGRTAAMVVSIALSVATVGALLTVRAVLDREVAANYLAGRPASATLHLAGPAGGPELATAAAVPGVTAATVRGTVTARVRVGKGPWRAMVLFVSADADPGRLAVAPIELGSWPPAVGQVFVERTALPYLGTAVGGQVQVRTAAGVTADLTVAGTVHDAGVAPAYQERTVYARATTSSVAALLGGPAALGPLDEVLVEVGAPNPVTGDVVSGDAATVTATAQKVAAALAATGHPVVRIDVPPPLRHPHYGQMVTVGWVMLAFGLAALLLSSVLVATLLGGLIGSQVRQIGAMKAVGATTGQVFALYLSLAAVVAVVATTVAIGPGLVLGRLMARQAAALLNLDLTSTAVPGWVAVITLVTGVVVPVLVAVPPLVRGSRRTVREAIEDHGVGGDDRSRSARALSRLTRLPGLGRDTMLGRDATLGMRNLARRPGRLALTVALMAVAGALFVTGLNAANGWDALVGDGIATRHYDLEVRLARPLPAAELSRLALAVPGVTVAQSWPRQPVTVARPGQVDTTAEYPDEAHGSFALLAVPPGTKLIRLPVRSGRWLRPDDGDALVLTSLAAQRQLPGAVVGDTVALTLAGRVTSWRLVGIVTDFGSQATAYVSTRGYAQAIPDGAVTASGSSASMVRVVTSASDAAGRAEVLARLSEALDAAGVPVASALAVDDLKAALDGHVFVLIEALVAVALLIAVVALLGLATVMSTWVTERTRELAVMQVVGATPGALRSMVLTEGLLTAGAAAVIAVAAAVPLTALFGSVIGRSAFLEPLPFRFSAGPVLAWLLVSLAGAALATTAAARAAGRLTVRQALTTL